MPTKKIKRDTNANTDKARAIRFPESTWKSLQTAADLLGGPLKTPSDVVRFAVDQFLAKFEEQAKSLEHATAAKQKLMEALSRRD